MTAAALEVSYAQRECERITRSQAANFYYGIRLLPRFKREAMCAVYAFARRVDDLGDDERGLDRDAKLHALARERGRLAALADGVRTPGDPVLTALSHAQRHYAIPADAFEALIQGVELDVTEASYETFEQLVHYCRCVAGSVGRMCAAIFTDGARPDLYPLADDLGVALQLTNILRDIVEDRRRGRVYLPAEDLARFSCVDPELADTGSMAALIRFEAARAAAWFERGLQLTAHLDRRSAASVQAMAGIYRRILDRIAEDPEAVLSRRVSLSPLEKTWVAISSLLGALGALR
ncbi:MAG: phytoene/squalene synthase family protein [Solirubrobacteraceae bacterium]